MVDVNVLVYAFREDTPHHARAKAVMDALLGGEAALGVSELVLSGFLRIVTHPRIHLPPSPLPESLAFAEAVRTAPNCSIVRPGPRHWELFADLCRRAKATGNEIPDAYHAALAIESDSEWITSDKGFARFPRLRWQYLFDPSFNP